MSCVPAKFRWFLRKDTFSAHSQVGPYKKAINAVLTRLIDSVENPYGVVLDGVHVCVYIFVYIYV